jgi:uncharacterized membrane protein
MIIEFLGHLHPVFVHLPIGFLILAYLLQYFFKIKEGKFKLIDFVLLLGVASSLFAAFLGWMLSLSGGYEENLLNWHRWTAILVCVFSIFLLAYKWFKKGGYATTLYHVMFQLMMLVLVLAGHFGGEMTHGEGYLFSFESNVTTNKNGSNQKSVLQKPTDTSTLAVYAGLIEPILSQKCMQCHNEKKKKGDFQMHNFEALMRGGKNGKEIIPGDLTHSEVIKRIMLDKEDDKHMPPKGKTQFTKYELDLLNWWVLHGVSNSQIIKEVAANDTIKKFLLSDQKETAATVVLEKISAPDSATMIELKKINVAIVPIATGTNFIEVNMVNAPLFNDKNAILLEKLSPQIMWLVLSDSKITDEGLSELKQCVNATKLNLKNTGITNASIPKIGALNKLEYLNIVGTKITDEGLLALNPSEGLKKIYCWNTGITEKGVQLFQKKYPKIEVDFGLKN